VEEVGKSRAKSGVLVVISRILANLIAPLGLIGKSFLALTVPIPRLRYKIGEK